MLALHTCAVITYIPRNFYSQNVANEIVYTSYTYQRYLPIFVEWQYMYMQMKELKRESLWGKERKRSWGFQGQLYYPCLLVSFVICRKTVHKVHIDKAL